jgi:mRNA interferase MazF
MKKFEIWNVDLDPKKGHAQAGTRPCIVIQSNLFNAHSPTVAVIPLTTTVRKVFPSEFLITPSQKNGLSHDSRALGSQLFTVDKQFFVKRLGVLEKKYWTELKQALHISLDWENMFLEEEGL